MFDPGIKLTEPMTVAFLAMKGPYAQIPEGMGRLYGTAAQMGLVPTGMPMAAYFTDPSEGPEYEAEWEIWAPVAGEPEPFPADESGLGIKLLPSERVVFAMHRGPYELIGDTYDRLIAWLQTEGHTMTGAPREAYLSDPNTTAPEDLLTEIQLPIGIHPR